MRVSAIPRRPLPVRALRQKKTLIDAWAVSFGDKRTLDFCIINPHGISVADIVTRPSCLFELSFPRQLVRGNFDNERFFALLLQIELRAAGVVDMPSVGVQRHRNISANIPDAMNVVGIAACNVPGGHYLLTSAHQVGEARRGTVIDPLVIDLLLLTFYANHYGPGLVVVWGRATVRQP